MRDRTLRLRRESIVELSATELDAVAGGSAMTCYCPTLELRCIAVSYTVLCIPTLRTCTS